MWVLTLFRFSVLPLSRLNILWFCGNKCKKKQPQKAKEQFVRQKERTGKDILCSHNSEQARRHLTGYSRKPKNPLGSSTEYLMTLSEGIVVATWAVKKWVTCAPAKWYFCTEKIREAYLSLLGWHEMVRKFELSGDFPATAEQFFNAVFRDSAFKMHFHRTKGDKGSK